MISHYDGRAHDLLVRIEQEATNAIKATGYVTIRANVLVALARAVLELYGNAEWAAYSKSHRTWTKIGLVNRKSGAEKARREREGG
jgi:hypothetical protein